MSNSFTAGQRLTAARMPRQRLWSVSSTTAMTATTVEAIALTSPAATYLANSAYILRIQGIVRAVSANGSIGIQVRDTNVAGTVRMLVRQVPLPTTLVNYNFFHEFTVANTTGSDITGRVLVLTATGVGTTVQFNAGIQGPYDFCCDYAGLNSDFPEAVAL